MPGAGAIGGSASVPPSRSALTPFTRIFSRRSGTRARSASNPNPGGGEVLVGPSSSCRMGLLPAIRAAMRDSMSPALGRASLDSTLEARDRSVPFQRDLRAPAQGSLRDRLGDGHVAYTFRRLTVVRGLVPDARQPAPGASCLSRARARRTSERNLEPGGTVQTKVFAGRTVRGPARSGPRVLPSRDLEVPLERAYEPICA